MDVRVEAVAMGAQSSINEVKTTVDNISVVISSPVVSRFSLAPVISVGGHSISSINPEILVRRLKAAV
jgi:hypothetical protein